MLTQVLPPSGENSKKLEGFRSAPGVPEASPLRRDLHACSSCQRGPPRRSCTPEASRGEEGHVIVSFQMPCSANEF